MHCSCVTSTLVSSGLAYMLCHIGLAPNWHKLSHLDHNPLRLSHDEGIGAVGLQLLFHWAVCVQPAIPISRGAVLTPPRASLFYTMLWSSPSLGSGPIYINIVCARLLGYSVLMLIANKR